MSSMIPSTPLIIGGVTLAGMISGYFIGKRFAKSKRSKFWKSYESDDPIVKYIVDHSLRLLPIQQRLMDETMKHELSAMMGAPEELQFLQNIIRAIKAKKIIEVGVFTGFSTLGFAMTIPEDGKIVACDVNSDYADIGKPYWKEAGVDHKIDLRIKPAVDSLNDLINNDESGTYDFAFIDADKANYDIYYEKCLQLIRKGGIIAVDNVFWNGSVLDPNSTIPGSREIQRLNKKLKEDNRIDLSMLKLADGVTLCFKR